MRLSRLSAPLIGASLLAAGCGNMDLDQRSVLAEYRVLAITADIPQPGPRDTVTLSVFEYDPAAIEADAETGDPFYAWEICPFSLGPLTEYDCFDPLAELGGAGMMMNPDMLPQDVQDRLPALVAELAALGVTLDDLPTAFAPQYVRTEGPELTLSMDEVGGVGVEALVLICGAVSPDGVCRTRGQEEVTLEQGWDVFVKLFSGREGVRRIDTIKVLKVRDFEGRNVNNPGVTQLDVDDPAGGAPVLVTEGKARVTVTIAADAAESYPDIQISSTGEVVRDDAGEPVTEPADEELTISWYSSDGQFELNRTTVEQLDNELTLPEEPGPVRLYVVVRDGRGGFGLTTTDIMVTGAATE